MEDQVWEEPGPWTLQGGPVLLPGLRQPGVQAHSSRALRCPRGVVTAFTLCVRLSVPLQGGQLELSLLDEGTTAPCDLMNHSCKNLSPARSQPGLRGQGFGTRGSTRLGPDGTSSMFILSAWQQPAVGDMPGGTSRWRVEATGFCPVLRRELGRSPWGGGHAWPFLQTVSAVTGNGLKEQGTKVWARSQMAQVQIPPLLFINPY